MHRLLLTAVLLIAACRTPDEDEPRVADNDSGRGTVSGVDRPADSLSITNRDGSVNLGLAGGRVWMALSDSVRAQVRQDLAKDTAASKDAGGIGGMIERTVKQNVQALLDQRVSRPLADIRDVRYEDGRIVFEYSGSSLVKFESIKVNREPVLSTFREDDARRFVTEVRRAKGLPVQE